MDERELEAPILDIIFAMNNGMSMCHEVLREASFSLEEASGAIDEVLLHRYSHEIGDLMLTDCSVEDKTPSRLPDGEDEDLDWFFEEDTRPDIKGKHESQRYQPLRVVLAAILLDRESMEMKIAAAVGSIFELVGKTDQWLDEIKIIQILGKPIESSRIMIGSCICLDSSDLASMDELAFIQDAEPKILKILLIEGSLFTPRSDPRSDITTYTFNKVNKEANFEAAVAFLSDVKLDAILCSGFAPPWSSRALNVTVISSLGVLSIRGIARACGVKPLASEPWCQESSAQEVATVRLDLYRGLVADDSVKSDTTTFLLVQPSCPVSTVGNSSVVVFLNSYTRSQSEASEVTIRQRIRSLESCCSRGRKSIIPGLGMSEIMCSNRLRSLAEQSTGQITNETMVELDIPLWCQFSAKAKEDRSITRAIVYSALADAFDDMSCALFQQCSSHLHYSHRVTRDHDSMAALQEGISKLKGRDGCLNATELQEIQSAISRAGDLDWKGLSVESLNSKEAGLRCCTLILGAILGTI